jgi:hypothetical protein
MACSIGSTYLKAPLLVSLSGSVACEASATDGLGSDPVPIVGGVDHTDLHPSVVFVLSQKPGEANAGVGSGIIVGPIMVLTAAHVVLESSGVVSPGDLSIFPGHIPTSDPALWGVRKVSHIFVHPGYRPESKRRSQHDIALLLLEDEPFPPSSIALLGDPDAHEGQGQSCGFEMVGYGSPFAEGEKVIRRAASTCLAPREPANGARFHQH